MTWFEYRLCRLKLDVLRVLVKDDIVLTEAIEKLLDRKRVSKGKEIGSAIPVLNAFIEQELNRLETFCDVPDRKSQDMQKLNSLFKEIIADC